MLKIVHDYIHCQHGNRLRPCAELGGRLPTPVTSPACPCSYPCSCSCSCLSCLYTVTIGDGMPGLYGRGVDGECPASGVGVSGLWIPSGCMRVLRLCVPLWYPCRSLALAYYALTLTYCYLLSPTMPSPLPVLAYRRNGACLWCLSCLWAGPHGPHGPHQCFQGFPRSTCAVHIGPHRRAPRAAGVNETVTARHVKQDGGASLPAWVSANLAGWCAGGRYAAVTVGKGVRILHTPVTCGMTREAGDGVCGPSISHARG